MEEIYQPFQPAGLTKDIRSAFYQLPDGTHVFALLREDVFPTWDSLPMGLIGDDVFYIDAHGGSSAGKRLSGFDYSLSYILVNRNSDGGVDKNNHVLPGLMTSGIQRPEDWPKRGLVPDNYKNELWGVRNYVELARVLTRLNPRWILTPACNQDDQDPAFGATPRYYDEMILLPPSQKRLRYIGMTSPGVLGANSGFFEPVRLEMQAGGKVGIKGFSGSRLFYVDGGSYEDRGLLLFERWGNYELPQEKTAAIEQFAIRQLGEKEYAYRMGILFKRGDKNPIGTALTVGPRLREEYEKYKLSRGAAVRNEQLLRQGFGDLLLSHSATMGTSRQFMTLTVAGNEETPAYVLGPDKYGCYLQKGNSMETSELVDAGHRIPGNAVSCTTVQRGSNDPVLTLPIVEQKSGRAVGAVKGRETAVRPITPANGSKQPIKH